MTDEDFIKAATNILAATSSPFMQQFCEKALEMAKRPRNRAEELAYFRTLEIARNFERRQAAIKNARKNCARLVAQ